MLRKIFRFCSSAVACAFSARNGGGHNRLLQLARGNKAFTAAQAGAAKLEFLASQPIFAVDRARTTGGDSFNVSLFSNDNGD
jgi:hypothetical protein